MTNATGRLRCLSMIKIYLTKNRALIVDEYLKGFYYVSRDVARCLAQGVTNEVYERQTHGNVQNYYESKGFKEEKWDC